MIKNGILKILQESLFLFLLLLSLWLSHSLSSSHSSPSPSSSSWLFIKVVGGLLEPVGGGGATDVLLVSQVIDKGRDFSVLGNVMEGEKKNLTKKE